MPSASTTATAGASGSSVQENVTTTGRVPMGALIEREIKTTYWAKERVTLAEFPSLEKAIAAFSSAAYGEALKALGDSAVRDFRIVEGVDQQSALLRFQANSAVPLSVNFRCVLLSCRSSRTCRELLYS